MADAQKLVDKIIGDARLDAENYWQEAEQKKKEMRADLNRAIEKRTAQIAQLAEEAVSENKKRLAAVYDLEYRKQLLAAKQEVMAQAKARAMEKLCALDKAVYLGMLKKQLLACAQDGQGGIIVSKDEKHIGDAFIKDVNAELKKSTGKGELSLLGEKRTMSGGFVYVNGGLEIDVSLEALLESVWQQSETDIAAVLFGQS